jgi:hypothetical protein
LLIKLDFTGGLGFILVTKLASPTFLNSDLFNDYYGVDESVSCFARNEKTALTQPLLSWSLG